MMLMGGLASAIATVQNLVARNPAAMTVTTGLCALVSFTAYAISRSLRLWRPLLVPVFLGYFALLIIGWLGQAGSSGGTGYFFFLIACSVVVLFPGKGKALALGACLGLVALLLGLERLAPQWIVTYPTDTQRFADAAFSLLLCLLCAAGLVFAVFREYQQERLLNERLLREVTEEKNRVEQSVRDKQRLLSMVCHDIANALTIIHYGAELLELKGQPDAKSTAQLGRMRFAANNIHEIIGSVKMIEAIEQGRISFTPEPVDLRMILDKSRELFAQRLQDHELRLELDVPAGSTPKVMAEPKTLANHVVNNLLSNAIKFSYPGSTIRLRIESHGSEVRLAVIDEGIGIPAHLLPHLFKPGSRTTRPGVSGEPGTGFGLLAAASFVDLYGGRIEVASRPEAEFPEDHSTTFTIHLAKAPGLS